MKRRRLHLLVRRSHRYLGVIFGIQFLFWTVSGLYFSWSNIEMIRGEDIRTEEPPLQAAAFILPVSAAVKQVQETDTVQYIKTVQPVQVLQAPYYQCTYFNGERMKTVLVHAATGVVRPPLSQEEAIAVAQSRVKPKAVVAKAAYITHTNGHHEYREKPLPAWAISFTGAVETTVYVSAEMGTVQSFRNNRWRIFDFLWMLHIMDYNERDNINNWLLRIFSAAGLITLFSGFLLYSVSLRRKKKHVYARQS